MTMRSIWPKRISSGGTKGLRRLCFGVSVIVHSWFDRCAVVPSREEESRRMGGEGQGGQECRLQTSDYRLRTSDVRLRGEGGEALVVVAGVEAEVKCPPPALRAPSPAASHAGEGVSKARCGVGKGDGLGEGFFNAPLLASGHPPPRLRTQERDEPGKVRESGSDRRGEGCFSAPLLASGHPPPRLRTQERE